MLVKAGLKALGKKYPDATFINADLYGFLDAVLNNPAAYGELCFFSQVLNPKSTCCLERKNK